MKVRNTSVSSSLSRYIVVLGLLGLAAFAAFLGGRRAFVHVYAETPISVRPYIMDYDSIVVHDGKEKIVGHTTESRRRDGAIHYRAAHYSASPGQQDAVFRRVDFPDGTTVMISDAAHAKSSGRRPATEQSRLNEAAFFDRTGPDCRSKTAIGETMEGVDTLLGYSAVRVSMPTGRDESEKRAGLSRVVFWLLPDFNCANAQDYSQTRSGPKAEWNTIRGNRLVEFAGRDPDPELFTNWLNYEEMKPSDIGRKLATMQGLTPETCPRCFAPDPSDKNYAKWHKGED